MSDEHARLPQTTAPINNELLQLIADLEALRADVLTHRSPSEPLVHPDNEASLRNLDHYLTLRSNDLRTLQAQLTAHGLSSLGRSESHVLATLDLVVHAAKALAGQSVESDPPVRAVPSALRVDDALERRTSALLGPRGSRRTRIMVTMPSAAAHDRDLVDALVASGMNIARINCAHDDERTWEAIAENVRAAATRTAQSVRVLMDLAGPKLRTGAMAPRPPVVKVRPLRDDLGHTTAAGRVRLVGPGRALEPDMVPVDAAFLADLRVGEVIRFHDARDASRELFVESISRDEAVGLTLKTTYLTNGLVLRTKRSHTKLSDLPAALGFVVLDVGEIVTFDDDDEPASAGPPVRIGCTLPEAVHALAPGHRVFFDDGKFAAETVHRTDASATLRITMAPEGGARLRAEKGINLPDTTVPVAALTEKDLADLASIVRHADMVALSFVRTADDVELLHEALDALGAPELGVVLKIETAEAFNNLPALLRTAMRRRNVGVMIARGDLAVEAGYERLAELQEEILWLCEAAHVPVIWATQVLDSLARTGRPSRAEVTDAAAGQRAECVMLNKGPFIVEAVAALDDILRRMEGHQTKKRPLLRQLRSWS